MPAVAAELNIRLAMELAVLVADWSLGMAPRVE